MKELRVWVESFPMGWLAVFFFFFSALSALEVEVSAPSAILMNAETGVILFEKNASTPMYPASTTKIATALFVLEKGIPLDTRVVVSAESLRHKSGKEGDRSYWHESDGTMMGLKRGEEVSLNTLLYGLMLVSGNDAANAIAETSEGSVERFVEEMNRYVKGLGCLNTQFQNPHGLHDPKHFTTARDLALIAKRALQFPKFREVVSALSYDKPRTNKQGPATLQQKNPLLKPGKHFYSKAIGGKTGYTSAAMNALAVAAQQEGRVLIAVVLGCAKRNERCEDVVRMFEAAFAEKEQLRKFFGREYCFSYEIEGAKCPLQASLNEDLEISYYPSEEPAFRAFVRWNTPHLPIRKGEKVGEVELCNAEGKVLKKGSLFAKEEVKKTLLFTVLQLLR